MTTFYLFLALVLSTHFVDAKFIKITKPKIEFDYEKALDEAIETGNIEKVRELLQWWKSKHFVSKGKKLLETACNKGFTEIAELLVNQGVEIDYFLTPLPEDQLILKQKLEALGFEIKNRKLIYGNSYKPSAHLTESLHFLHEKSTNNFSKDVFSPDIYTVANDIIALQPDIILVSPSNRIEPALKLAIDNLSKKQTVSLVPLQFLEVASIEPRKKENIDTLTWLAKLNGYAFAKPPYRSCLAEDVIMAHDLIHYINDNFASKRVLIISRNHVHSGIQIALKTDSLKKCLRKLPRNEIREIKKGNSVIQKL